MTTTKKPTVAVLAARIETQAATIESLENTLREYCETVVDIHDTLTSQKELIESQAEAIIALQYDVIQLQTAKAEAHRAKGRSNGNGQRDYGPQSTRKMTDIDAWRILFGDLAGMKARPLADHLGLSRGQVYSVLGGYTFKHILPESFSNPSDAPLLLTAE